MGVVDFGNRVVNSESRFLDKYRKQVRQVREV